MGLDMYLYAERDFHGTDARSILESIGDPRGVLAAIEEGEAGGEAGLYLSGYEFQPKDRQDQYNAVIDAGNMRPFADPHSPSAWLMSDAGGHKVTIRVTAIYWRKANAVHGWFVDNAQDGIDECQVAPVTREQLRLLSSACQTSLNSVNSGLRSANHVVVKPRAGFFFGGTDIDEWYERDLQHTRSSIDNLLSKAPDDMRFAYHSSW